MVFLLTKVMAQDVNNIGTATGDCRLASRQ